MADMLPHGEYLLRNMTTRPDLNGKVCAVTVSKLGAGDEKHTYAIRVQETGDHISVHADKLMPLSEAPHEMLYDDDDLDREDHPLAASLCDHLRLGRRVEGFGVPEPADE